MPRPTDEFNFLNNPEKEMLVVNIRAFLHQFNERMKKISIMSNIRYRNRLIKELKEQISNYDNLGILNQKLVDYDEDKTCYDIEALKSTEKLVNILKDLLKALQDMSRDFPPQIKKVKKRNSHPTLTNMFEIEKENAKCSSNI